MNKFTVPSILFTYLEYYKILLSFVNLGKFTIDSGSKLRVFTAMFNIHYLYDELFILYDE